MVGSIGTGEDSDVDYDEDLLGEEDDPPVPVGSGEAASGGAAAAETATKQPDFAALGSDPAALGRLLQGFQDQLQQSEARAAKAERESKEQLSQAFQRIETLTEKLAAAESGRPTPALDYVPVSGDNTFVPERHTQPNAGCPKLQRLKGKCQVYDSLVGPNPVANPNGRALDWCTVVTLCTFLFDFGQFLTKTIVPALKESGLDREAEQAVNSFTGIYRLAEQRHSYLQAAAQLGSTNAELVAGFFDRMYSEVLTGEVRDGSDWADFYEKWSVLRDAAVQKFAATQSAARSGAGRNDLRDQIDKHKKPRKGKGGPPKPAKRHDGGKSD